MSQGVSAPPALSDSILYTDCYCEENVWLLAQQFQSDPEVTRDWDTYAIFISNANKTVALWRQKARPDVVIWDYHVVLLVRWRRRVEELTCPSSYFDWIYDMDTTLSVPCQANDYLEQTFKSCSEPFASRFRVVPAPILLAQFASDRSHMLVSSPPSQPREENSEPCEYQMPTPPYPPICGPNARSKDVKHNLMTHFVDMTAEGFGEVVNLTLLTAWLGRMTTTQKVVA